MTRVLPVVLLVLVVLIQYPLWLGKGSWLRVWELDRQLSTQQETNTKLQVRNAAMDAEVRDLKQGLDAIEERARSELGMIKPGEVFVQVLAPGHAPIVPKAPESSTRTPVPSAKTPEPSTKAQ
jgi:cell division protein FtsB